MHFGFSTFIIKYINVVALLLLLTIFIFFRLLGIKERQQLDYNITILLRNEFNSANSYALAKSIIDVEKIGLFECGKLVELNDNSRIFFDSTANKKCNGFVNKIILLKNSSKIDSLSGVSYQFSYLYKKNIATVILEIIIYSVLLLFARFLPKHFTNLLKIERTNYTLVDLENKNRKTLFALSQKLAHDIRSPISTLNIISSKISDNDIKFLQLAVVDQINAIANGLLNHSQESIAEIEENKIAPKKTLQTESNSYSLLSDMFKNLEKEYQFKSIAISQKIIFEINYQQIELNCIDQKRITIVYTCLNNFIQNALDATTSLGIIKICAIKNSENRIEISVSDNGKGIPASIINRLGNEVLSYNKNTTKDKEITNSVRSGNGIALFNARRDLQENGAKLVINSIENKMTEIKILI